MKIAFSIAGMIIVVLSALMWVGHSPNTQSLDTAPNSQAPKRSETESVIASTQTVRETSATDLRETDFEVEAITQVSEAPSSEDEMMQVLPGLPDFKIPTNVRSLASYAEQLAAEAEDGLWASSMKGKILTEIVAVAATSPVNRIEIECRTTWCGIVVDYYAEFEYPKVVGTFKHLEDVIPLSVGDIWISSRPDGSGFLTIYAQYDR